MENTIEKISLDTNGNRGSLEHLNFDGLRVCIRDLISLEALEEKVSNDLSVFKLHFTIQGSYHFAPSTTKKATTIPQGDCNLYRFSKVRGFQKFTGKSISSVEIFFTETYLRSLLGEPYEKVFKSRTDFLSTKNANCLWKNGKKIPPKLIPYLMGILRCKYSDRAKASFVKAKIDCIVIEFFLGKPSYLTAESNDALTKTDYAAILELEAYIKQNLKKNLTIEHLSSVAGLNTTKLKHDFKKVFATTIFKHITQMRMEKAKQLVLNKNYSIAQASYEVGYTNPQHFTVAFKKTMGYLPSNLKEICSRL